MRAREQLPMAITPTLPFGTFTLTVESESGTRASGTFTVVEDAAAALEQRFVLR